MAAERCPTCQADVAIGSTRCWLCGNELPVLAEVVPEPQRSPGKDQDWVLHGSLWLATTAVLLLMLGLLQLQHPYFALALAIVGIPAVAAAFAGAALGRLLEKPLHPAVKVAVGAAVAVVLLPVAVVIALCVACFDALGAFRGGP
jgi:hypothetical protein